MIQRISDMINGFEKVIRFIEGLNKILKSSCEKTDIFVTYRDLYKERTNYLLDASSYLYRRPITIGYSRNEVNRPRPHLPAQEGILDGVVFSKLVFSPCFTGALLHFILIIYFEFLEK